MLKSIGKNVIASSGLPPFFLVADPDHNSLTVPELRQGDAVRTSVRSLSGYQKEALVSSARTGRTWRLVSDEGPYLNGHDAAPCPLAFFSVGMAASYLNEIVALAEKRGIVLNSLRLVQDNFYTMKGSMLRRTMVGGAEPVELEVEVRSKAKEAALTKMLADAIFATPANGLLWGQLTSQFRLARNGLPLPTRRSRALASSILPDPKGTFDRMTVARPAQELVSPVGETPRKTVELGTRGVGSSLQEVQDRRLNIGAIATIKEDGIKYIQQMQYSPHGTSFLFHSSEDGRAPDAATLMSAGIGFCFMTQFGRFVSMLNLDLPAYRIVQDTHFSLGGASGETGQPGTAGPVETHVFLETSESDAVAQEMLEISEQTCFLHALCRTKLKPRLKISRL